MDKKVNLKKEIFQWSITLAGDGILLFFIKTKLFLKKKVIRPSMNTTVNDKKKHELKKLS